MKTSDRAIVNVAILYGKAFLTAGLVLLSTRWVLEALGEEDYGIYNLVGGIMAMFSFLNVAMAAATQRFLSYSLGSNNPTLQQDTFRGSLILHIGIAIIVFILFEILGKYLMFHHLNIPTGRVSEAILVLHCLSIMAFFTIVSVPFQALLNSHENMIIVALISIYESVIKLVIGYVLLKYWGDRLILYAILMMLLSFSTMSILMLYCHKHYEEVKGNLLKFKNYILLKKMFSFAGWNFIGSISSILRNQGLAMLMNSFFGIVVNASYGIATQVNGQAQFFSRTIIRALQPQIAKSEGAKDRDRMIRISMTTCKITFLILSLAIIPLIGEMNLILSIWLTEIPEYTSIFCKLVLLTTLIGQLKMGMAIAIESVGNIKWYQIICGGLHFIVLPIAYVLYKLGDKPEYGLYFIVVEESVIVILTTLFAKKFAGVSFKDYLREILVPSSLLVLSGWVLCTYALLWINNPFFHAILYFLIYVSYICTIAYYFILNSWERTIIIQFSKSLKNKIFK